MVKKELRDQDLAEYIDPIFKEDKFEKYLIKMIEEKYVVIKDIVKSDKFLKFLQKSDKEISIPSFPLRYSLGTTNKDDFNDKKLQYFTEEFLDILADFYVNFYRIKICAKDINESDKERCKVIAQLEKIRDSNKFLLNLHRQEFDTIIQTLELQQSKEYTTPKSFLKKLSKSIEQLLIKYFGYSKNPIIAIFYDGIFPGLPVTSSSVWDHLKK